MKPYRHDFQLLADFFADGVFTTAARASQFVFGQFVDDFSAWQVCGQRFAFAPALGRGNDFFVRLIGDRNCEAFGLIKERELRRLRIDCSWMWVQPSGPPERPVVLFDYTTSRAQEVPLRLLADDRRLRRL